MWPAIYICSDIAYLPAVSNEYTSNLGRTYYSLIVQISGHLSDILNFEIIFQANSNNELVRYIDFNHAGFIDDQK